MLACLGVVAWVPVTAFGIVRLIESRLEIPASEGEKEWTLYLERIPGDDVVCRRGASVPRPAPPDGSGHFVCTVPRVEGDTKGKVPLTIEYRTWFGFRRALAHDFDAADWADGKMWSGYYSSGYGYATFEPLTTTAPRRFRFFVTSSALTTVRYGVDTNDVAQVLPEGVTEIELPPGVRFVASCMVQKQRRYGTAVVRHFEDRKQEVLEPLRCPLDP